jgi:DNA-binding HxlR family transcriptional regulator
MVSKNEHAQRSQCPVACGLDIIGDHWTLIVIRDLLMLGRHEYRDMLEAEEGISSNILSDRLKKLQDTGLVKWIPHPQSKKRKLYYLSPRGKDLIYVLISIARWSGKHLSDQVDIQLAVAKNPDEFVTGVLLSLQQWEKDYGITNNSG